MVVERIYEDSITHESFSNSCTKEEYFQDGFDDKISDRNVVDVVDIVSDAFSIPKFYQGQPIYDE